MRKNKFINLELGAKLKKFTMRFSVFAITFCVVSAILNTGGTYAVDSGSACYYCSSDGGTLWESTLEEKRDCSAGWKTITEVTNSVNCNYDYLSYNTSYTTEVCFYCSGDGGALWQNPSAAKRDCASGWKTINEVTKGANCNYSYISSINSGNTDDKSYSATFKINNGTWADGTKNDRTKTYTSTYSLVNNSEIAVGAGPNGESLCGWYSTNQKTVLTLQLDSVNNGDTLTANWCEDVGTPDTPTKPDAPSTETTVTATLYPQNGSGNITKTCTIASGENSCEISLPSVKKENSTFDGWSTSSSCTGTKVAGSDDISEDTKYYACFTLNSDTTDPGDTPSDGDSDINENPNTGNWLLYVAYLVGALALGYTGYYSYKMVKAKNNN